MRSATPEEIVIIKSGKCPACESEDIDFLSFRTAGIDKCYTCNAYWSTRAVRKDGQRIDYADFERRCFEEDTRAFEDWYQENMITEYTISARCDYNPLQEGFRTAFPIEMERDKEEKSESDT